MGVISQRKEVTIQEGRSRSRKCRGNPGTGPLQLLVHCILQCPSVTWLYAPVFDQNMSQKFVKSLLSVTARPVIWPAFTSIPNLIITPPPQRNTPQYLLSLKYLGNRESVSCLPGGQSKLQLGSSDIPYLSPTDFCTALPWSVPFPTCYYLSAPTNSLLWFHAANHDDLKRDDMSQAAVLLLTSTLIMWGLDYHRPHCSLVMEGVGLTEATFSTAQDSNDKTI